jgi:hypothetical protein
MPLNIAFESIDETQMRLEGTIVRYDGVPVYVNQVSGHDDGNARVHLKALPITDGQDLYRDEDSGGSFRPLPRRSSSAEAPPPPPAEPTPQRTIRKVINSPKLDMEPLELGYFNTPNGVYHASRMPTRKYKQGLSSQNCLISSTDPNVGSRYSFSHVTQMQGFFDMLVGNYSSLRGALQQLQTNPGLNCVAVHYEYYIRRHPLGLYFLHNSQTEIGVCTDADWSGLRIAKDYKYLREVLTKIFPTTSLEFMEQ